MVGYGCGEFGSWSSSRECEVHIGVRMQTITVFVLVEEARYLGMTQGGNVLSNVGQKSSGA